MRGQKIVNISEKKLFLGVLDPDAYTYTLSNHVNLKKYHYGHVIWRLSNFVGYRKSLRRSTEISVDDWLSSCPMIGYWLLWKGELE